MGGNWKGGRTLEEGICGKKISFEPAVEDWNGDSGDGGNDEIYVFAKKYQ